MTNLAAFRQGHLTSKFYHRCRSAVFMRYGPNAKMATFKLFPLCELKKVLLISLENEIQKNMLSGMRLVSLI